MTKLIFVIRRSARPARLILLFAAVICVVASTAPSEAQSPALTPELEKLRDALEKYKDPLVAVHDGYRSTLGCVEYPQGGGQGRVPYPPGGMGVHFAHVRPAGPEPDPMRPNILVYEPDGDKLRLVAAEWLIPLATGIKERPKLFGQPFDGPMEGHHPLQPTSLHHYDLHVWLWKANPTGLFSPTNPNVKCSGYGYRLPEEAPRLVPHP
jgi:hypothetical protein